jgi:hypothetical protein
MLALCRFQTDFSMGTCGREFRVFGESESAFEKPLVDGWESIRQLDRVAWISPAAPGRMPLHASSVVRSSLFQVTAF